jgi:hypothetical protein
VRNEHAAGYKAEKLDFGCEVDEAEKEEAGREVEGVEVAVAAVKVPDDSNLGVVDQLARRVRLEAGTIRSQEKPGR